MPLTRQCSALALPWALLAASPLRQAGSLLALGWWPTHRPPPRATAQHLHARALAPQAAAPSLHLPGAGGTACQASSRRPFSERAVILGIETSCDDTGAAVVSSDRLVLGEAVASQGEVHAAWGGVVPSLARDEHQKAIDRVVDEAMAQAGLALSDLTAVAVTVGPGLSLCLRVGVAKARAIAAGLGLPLVPVHHMEAHALLARLTDAQPVEFPFLVLLVSGGHNLLVLAHAVGHYTQLGTTLDDAVGEAFDKTARLLGLDMTRSGGAALEELAREGDPQAFRFSLPLRGVPSCDFSYAGLKTAAARCIEQEAARAHTLPLAGAAPEDRALRANIAASFQRVAVEHLEDRTRRAIALALELEPRVKCLVVSGGVASNTKVRQHLQAISAERGLRLVCPPPRLCTDNGVMVAWAGLERFRLGFTQDPPSQDEPEDAFFELRARWPLGEALPGSKGPPRSSKKKRMFPSLTSETLAAAASAQTSATR